MANNDMERIEITEEDVMLEEVLDDDAVEGVVE
jgi:hypothetical protein